MRLLDCGCGPGSITLDLAEIVAPGEVVGIDIASNQLDVARRDAAKRGLSNVHFEAGNINELDFRDQDFDAVFIHAVLEHVNDPLRALTQCRRVLKQGGILGVREGGRDGRLTWPESSAVDRLHELRERLVAYGGGDPTINRKVKSLLLEAGFGRVQASASHEFYETRDSVEWLAVVAAQLTRDPGFTSVMLREGWTAREELDRIGDGWREWAAHLGAFYSMSWCEAVGWKE